jgi:hypothetical protein
MFTSWSGDASATVQIINPTLNGDKSFHASFASVPNTNNAYLNSTFESALEVLPGSLKTTILQLFQNGDFIISATNYGLFSILHSGGSYIITYNTSVLSSDNTNGMKLVWLHEFWHLNSYANGGANDHESMVADPTYQGWIESLFPDFPSELLKYNGATDTTGFDSLPSYLQNLYWILVMGNGFYY